MTPDELEAAVRELQDRQAINDCLMTYSRAVDRLDRELLLSVYHEDAVDDHGMFVGTREEFADWALPMHEAAQMSTQHCILNYTVELDGDVAHVESYWMFIGLNRRGRPLSVCGGRYLDRFEKRDGRWAIAARICVRDWAPLPEPPEVLDQAAMTSATLTPEGAELARSGPQISRDRNDPSYQRPLPVRTPQASRG
jgi:ketosteroid isomerase-like protein